MEKNHHNAVLTFGLRGLRRLLIAVGWALHLASQCAIRLAEVTDRCARRTKAWKARHES